MPIACRAGHGDEQVARDYRARIERHAADRDCPDGHGGLGEHGTQHAARLELANEVAELAAAHASHSPRVVAAATAATAHERASDVDRLLQLRDAQQSRVERVDNRRRAAGNDHLDEQQ